MKISMLVCALLFGCGENYNPDEQPPILVLEDEYEDDDDETGSEDATLEKTDQKSENINENGDTPSPTGESRSIETKYSFEGEILGVRSSGKVFGWATLAQDPFVHISVSIIVGSIEDPSAIIGPFSANKPFYDNDTTGSHGFSEKLPKDLINKGPLSLWLVVEFDEQVYQLSNEPFLYRGSSSGNESADDE